MSIRLGQEAILLSIICGLTCSPIVWDSISVAVGNWGCRLTLSILLHQFLPDEQSSGREGNRGQEKYHEVSKTARVYVVGREQFPVACDNDSYHSQSTQHACCVYQVGHGRVHSVRRSLARDGEVEHVSSDHHDQEEPGDEEEGVGDTDGDVVEEEEEEGDGVHEDVEDHDHEAGQNHDVDSASLALGGEWETEAEAEEDVGCEPSSRDGHVLCLLRQHHSCAGKV